MRYLICAFFCINGFAASAQKNIKALIHAERSFAAYTTANGIKKGFLQFLESSAVVFPGADAVNGIALHSKSPGSNAVLSWAPEYAVISTSGDFGFTTGPYHLRSSKNDTISSRGQYSSIWQMNKTGEWKVLADMGITYTYSRSLPDHVAELDLKKINTLPFTNEELTKADQLLNQQLQEKGNAAYGSYLTAQSWFNIQNHIPVMGARDIGDLLKTLSPPSAIQHEKAGIAASNDLGFTYGKLNNSPYLRVWTKQQTGWGLLLVVSKQ